MLLLVILTCYGILRLNPQYKTSYLAAISKKYKKLESVKSNKIVIIGGSNGAFGIDSDLMENELQMPVVNMALHGDIGIKYNLDFVKNNLKKGDILILTPEFNTLTRERWYGLKGDIIPTVITYTPSKLYIFLSDYKFFSTAINGIMRSVKATWLESPFPKTADRYTVYDSRAFESDNIKDEFLNDIYKKDFVKEPVKFKKESLALDQLKAYEDYFKEKGVKLYINPPAALIDKFVVNDVEKFMDSLSTYTNIPLLGNGKSYLYEKVNFLNTEYHLNNKGRKTRTQQLIKDIKKNNLIPSSPEKSMTAIILAKDNSIKLPLQLLDNYSEFKMEYDYLPDFVIAEYIKAKTIHYTRTKIEGEKYRDYLIQIKVNADEEIVNDLEFKGLGNYKFDNKTKTPEGDYILSKKLSNLNIHAKGFTFLGVTSTKTDNFMGKNLKIEEMRLWDESYNYSTFGNIIFADDFLVAAKTNQIIFSVEGQNQSIALNRITTIDSDQKIIGKGRKYKLDISNNKIELLDFYTGEKVLDKNKETNFVLKFHSTKEDLINISY
ncbi:MAG: hypothetical protein R2797_02310 [Gelidibacter sp.]